MSVDTAFARLRDANPVPEPARLRDKSQDLNALFAATRQRSMEMDTELEIVETQKTTTPMWRKALPGLVAAAVVILVGAVILLLARDTEPDVADTPQGMAVLFIEGDADTAVELLATDAAFEDTIETSVEEHAAFREWQVAIGMFATVTGCSETPIGSTVEVSCTYTHGNAWTDALGVGPFTGSQWDFVISGGQIQELQQTFDDSEYSPQAWEVFMQWLRFNHALDRSSMVEAVGSEGVPILTPESIALWAQYTNEFVASVEESDTP
jgi:hypothetical protein